MLPSRQATPLYQRLEAAGRLTRPKHWPEFKSLVINFSPPGLSSAQAEREVRQAWEASCSTAAHSAALRWLEAEPFPDRVIHLLVRPAFRGICCPRMRRRDRVKVLVKNRISVLRIVRQALAFPGFRLLRL